MLYKADDRLIGSRAKHNEVEWSGLQFADDIAIISTSRQKMELATSSLAEVTGLTISTAKTKAMVIGNSEEGQQHLTLGEEQIEVMDQFKYLGSVLHHFEL